MPDDALENIKIGIDADGAVSGVDEAIAALKRLSDAADELRTSGGSTSGVSATGRAIAERAGSQVAGLSGQLRPEDIAQVTRQLTSALSRLEQAAGGAGRALSEEYTRTLSRGREALRSAQRRGSAEEGGTDFGTGRRYGSLREFVEGETRIRRSNAAGSGALATSRDYLQANASAEIANQQNQAAKLRALRTGSVTDAAGNTTDYVTEYANAQLQAQRLRSATQLRVAQGTTPGDIQASGQAQAAQNSLKVAQELEVLASTTAEDITASGQLIAAKKRQTAEIELAAQADAGYAAAVEASVTVQKARQAIEAEAAGTQDNVNSSVRTELARRRTSTATTSGVLGGITDSDINASAANSAEQARIRSLTQLAELEQRDIEVEAQLTVAKEEYQKRLQEAIGSIRGGQGKATGLGFGQGGTLFQQLTGAFTHSRNGSTTNEDLPTLGQFAGRHAVNTLGYALPGIAIGGGIEELRASVQEAEKAQLSFRELEAQVNALGQGNQFATFKTNLQGIANETGLAVSEVAQLGIAMEGVYGNTNLATQAVQNISVATVAMGLTLGEAEKDVIAITQSFSGLQNAGPAAITTISNEALHLEDLTGVNSKDILAGTADLAPVANQLGLNYNQTASLVAGTSQVSGQSASDVATNLGRIIPQFSQNLPTIAEYYNQLPALAGSRGAFTNDVNSGDISQAFEQFLANFKQIPSQAQSAIATDLGDVRYAPTLIAAGESNQTKLASSAAPANRTQEQFQLQLGTLEVAFEKLRQSAVNLGVNILDSGLGNDLVDIAKVAGDVINVFGGLNRATGGVVSHLTELAGIVLLFEGAIKVATTATSIFAAKEAASGTEVAAGGSAALLGDAGVGGAGALAAGAGLGTVGSVGLAAAGGALIGYGLYGESKKSGALGTTARIITDPVTEATKGVFDVFGGGGSTGPAGSTTKWAQQQEDYVNTQIKPRIQALTQVGVLTPAQEQALEALYKNDNQYGDYKDLLNLFTSDLAPDVSGQNKKGQSLLDQVNDKIKGPAGQTRSSDPNFDGPLPAALATPATPGQKATAVAGVNSNAIITSPEDYSELYEAGGTSLQQYEQSLQGEIKTLKGQASGPNGNQPAYDQIPQYLQELTQVQDQLAQQGQQFVQELQAQGSPAGDITILSSLTNELKNVKDPSDQLSAIGAYVQAVNTQTQDLANNATSGAAKNLALTRSVSLPSSITNIIKGNPQLAAILQQAGYNINGASITSFTPSTQLYANLQSDVSAQQALATAQAGGGQNPVGVAAAGVQAAQANLANIKSTGDQNIDDYKNAEAALLTAQQQLATAGSEVAQAQFGYYSQLFSNDPIKSTQESINQAKAALQLAQSQGNGAGVAQAEQTLAQLNNQQNQNIIDYADALASISEAQSNVQGNPIAVAQKTYQQALQDAATRANYDKSIGVNPQQDTQYQNDIATALNDQANVMSTIVSTLTSNIEDELTLGQVTATQAIAQLEAALTQVKGNQQQTLAIETEIRSIQNSAGSQLNFDLPTTLVPTTLYQARSLEQFGNINSGSNGAVTVNIQVNGGNAAQINSAVSKLTAAVGGPSRTGTNPPLLNN